MRERSRSYYARLTAARAAQYPEDRPPIKRDAAPPRHAKGYEDYRRATETQRHSVGGLWQDTSGRWYCGCGWAVTR